MERLEQNSLKKLRITARPAFNPEGAMVDVIDTIEWEDTKDDLREIRTSVIIIEGGPRGRGTQTCEIQNMLGGSYVWQTGKSTSLDVMTLNTVKKAAGTLMILGDQSEWANSPVLTHRIRQEKERRSWTQL